jgi:integrase/recombinase XerD
MPPETSTAHITSETSLTPAINAWKIYLHDQDNSIHTVKAFSADVKLLAGYLSPDHSLGSVSTTDLNNFLHWMQHERGVPCSPKTLSRRITSLKAFFRWLQANGVILVDPAEKVVQKSVLSPLPEALEAGEVELILETANRHREAAQPDARPYALLKLLLDTAIKKGECLELTTKHIDLDAPNGPILFVRYANPNQRYKERKLLLSEDWVAAYQEYQGQYDLSEGLFPWSPRRLEYLLEDLSKEAGLEKNVSFLMCRWTSALIDLKAGIDPNKIRQKLGVSEIQWREVKTKLDRLAGKTETTST